ncbi:PREDICTED: uncharacterized protein LOC105562346 [Vollenhovia emeryi]|uniref:uncharacterized protein LOC105562346 n=1 Tax=Vollenhovia emeryi TaxID=411798 RepID=UPI0005F3B7D7|nr:PREDICTED: uncharacterized protein LOC105562346 [Vollenhovia emeryi]XP_011868503.1 PREDICTED: uncharacterized protein LOC105562346 [Vollenhovia emeryi]XP_011868504.1 PREDICTED: uncharacterized protein LOC105562346 [Vollenhovia emeryi]
MAASRRRWNRKVSTIWLHAHNLAKLCRSSWRDFGEIPMASRRSRAKGEVVKLDAFDDAVTRVRPGGIVPFVAAGFRRNPGDVTVVSRRRWNRTVSTMRLHAHNLAELCRLLRWDFGEIPVASRRSRAEGELVKFYTFYDTVTRVRPGGILPFVVAGFRRNPARVTAVSRRRWNRTVSTMRLHAHNLAKLCCSSWRDFGEIPMVSGRSRTEDEIVKFDAFDDAVTRVRPGGILPFVEARFRRNPSDVIVSRRRWNRTVSTMQLHAHNLAELCRSSWRNFGKIPMASRRCRR